MGKARCNTRAEGKKEPVSNSGRINEKNDSVLTSEKTTGNGGEGREETFPTFWMIMRYSFKVCAMHHFKMLNCKNMEVLPLQEKYSDKIIWQVHKSMLKVCPEVWLGTIWKRRNDPTIGRPHNGLPRNYQNVFLCIHLNKIHSKMLIKTMPLLCV